jgi:excisionase family DNA binding protein/PAS domain S-box-containing protein
MKQRVASPSPIVYVPFNQSLSGLLKYGGRVRSDGHALPLTPERQIPKRRATVSSMAMEKPKKGLLTVKEVAAYLRVNQTTIYRLVRKSQIPSFKVGGNWRFNLESIDEWRLNSNAVRLESHDPVSPRSPMDTEDLPSDLARLTQTIVEMIAPIAWMQTIIPRIESIARAIEGKRDAADEVARLYEGQAVPYRTHWENLFEFAPVAFGVVNSKGRLVSFNDAYCRLFGFSSKQLRTVLLTDLVHDSDLDRFTTVNRQLLMGEAESAEFVCQRLTAKGVPILTRAQGWSVRRRPSRKPEYVAAVVERIVTREEAAIGFERCAEKLFKRRETFLPHR